MARSTKANRAEIAIVGGGLAGASLALALGQAGRDVAFIAPPAPRDQRTSALMLPTARFLQSLGLFEDAREIATPLERIRLIDATKRLIRAPETLFDARSAGLEAFSYNFGNADLLERLNGAIAKLSNIKVVAEKAVGFSQVDGDWTVTLSSGESVGAALLVGADGKKSPVRQALGITVRNHDFAQSALVCDLELGRDLGPESVEFHYPNGPFTLVPAGGSTANLVWVDKADALRHAAALPEAELMAEMKRKSLNLYGDIALRSRVFVFPLSTLSANTAGRNGGVLVGEAAHAFPPIGAQGLNLGLRDVEDLVEAIKASPRIDTADQAMALSEAFARKRAGDIDRTTRFVDTLFRSLLSDLLPQQMVRAGGIWALKLIPPLRKKAFEVGMGAGR
ncbi:MAG: FAD-dependent monooxygenase [Hyphomicrobiaceae bacterium]|nr:FAD-dependent monooxygenase [Hyphomicrobiaceae bacterium]